MANSKNVLIYLFSNELTFNVDEKVETFFSQQHFSRFADTIYFRKEANFSGPPQPFKTMFYRLRRETKNSNIPTLKNIE